MKTLKELKEDKETIKALVEDAKSVLADLMKERENKKTLLLVLQDWAKSLQNELSTGEKEEEVVQRIKILLEQRRLIDAVRLYRTTHNTNLLEAKNVVDKIRASMGIEFWTF